MLLCDGSLFENALCADRESAAMRTLRKPPDTEDISPIHGEQGPMDEYVHEVVHIVVALEGVVATMLSDLTRRGFLNRQDYIHKLRRSEAVCREENQHPAGISTYRRLRRHLGDSGD
jgi:hypothetical protein